MSSPDGYALVPDEDPYRDLVRAGKEALLRLAEGREDDDLAALRIEEEREDRELLAIVQRLDAEDEIDQAVLQRVGDEHDAALVAPYRKRLKALRAAGEDDTAIYEALIRLAKRRGDDYGEVLAVLLEDGSIRLPYEAP